MAGFFNFKANNPIIFIANPLWKLCKVCIRSHLFSQNNCFDPLHLNQRSAVIAWCHRYNQGCIHDALRFRISSAFCSAWMIYGYFFSVTALSLREALGNSPYSDLVGNPFQVLKHTLPTSAVKTWGISENLRYTQNFMYISQPRTKFLLGDQNTLRKMYYLSDIIANSRIHKVLSHDVTSVILLSQKYMKRGHVGGSPTNLVRFEPFPYVKCFFCSNKLASYTDHVSEKALYVADTSEGKGERRWAASMKEGKGSFISLSFFSFHPETI